MYVAGPTSIFAERGCRSYGAARKCALCTYKDLAPTEPVLIWWTSLETKEWDAISTEQQEHKDIRSTHRPKALVRIAVREEFVPREKSVTVLIFSAYV
jgi:hypothetical protein